MGKILTLHEPHAAREYYQSGVWQSETMYSMLLHQAQTRPSAHAFRDPWLRLTWLELLDRVDRVAADLARAGLQRGDRVCVWLPSRVEAVMVLLACSRNGYVCNPSLHQNYTVDEVVGLLERIQAKALFAQAGYGADAARADVFARANGIATMKRVYAVEPRSREHARPQDAVAFPADAAKTQAPPVLDPDKIVYLAFTSGTTGTPKAVMHSDNTLLANGRAMAKDWHHDASTVLLSISPMSHHIGTVALEQALVAGCELVVNDPASGKRTIDWILECGATYVMGVPTHAMDVLAALQERGMDRLGRVAVFYMAGAAIPRETAEKFLEIGVTPQNVYGMTENGSHQYTLPSDSAETITSTCGRACHGYEVKLWQQDNADEEVAAGEVGEIGSRGGLLTLGYFANQAATEASFNAHGWFMSGDLGRMDKAGNLQIVGRKKDLIIRGGHNIYPARIEDLALRHPRVARAAAFSVSDERLGEKVCLAIIADGDAPDASELLSHLDGAGLSKFDMPEYFVVLPEFPLTASGKILKRELVEWARSGRIAPIPVRFTASATKGS